MTSPFVPVDLNKLLDDFEENEAPITGQHTSLGEEDARSLLNSSCKAPRQSFQPAFPCIQEEVLSDQGSDGGRLEDKYDSSSDSSSISGVIAAAEAITSKGLDQMTPEQSGNCITESSDISDAQANVVNNTLGDATFHQEEHLCFDNEHVMVDTTKNTSKSQSVSALSYHVSNGYDASREIQLIQSIGEEEKGNVDGDLDLSVGTGILQLSEDCEKSQSGSRDTSENLADISSTKEVRGSFCNGQTIRINSCDNYNNSSVRTDGPSSGADGCSSDLDGHRPVDNHATESVNSASLSEKQDDVQPIGHNGFESSNVVTQPGHEFESHLGELTQVSSYTLQNSTCQNVGLPHLTNSSQDPNHIADLVIEPANQGVNQIPEPVLEPTNQVPNQIPDPAFEPPNQDSPHQDLNSPIEPWESSSIASQMSGSHAGMKPQGCTGARRISSGAPCLGTVPPIWVPDSVATHCMNCGLKFTVVKRRHHCRACGKALCSSCCNMKFALPYMDNREGRVCEVCCNALLRAQTVSQVQEQESNTIENNTDSLIAGEEEVPEEVTITSPNSDQESTEVVEQSSEGNDEEGADSQTSHSGVDASGEHTVPVLPPLQLPDPSLLLPNTDSGTPLATPTSPALSDDSDCLFRLDLDNVRSLLPQSITALPPVLSVINEEIIIQESPDPAEIMYQLKGCHETVVFMLNKNLVVKVKIVKLKCCMKCKCWCFVTEGMGAANQEEMVVLLECLDGETMVPKDVLSHFNTAFAYAKQGHTVSELGYTIFGQPFLGSGDNAGFLYVKPTFQCLKNLPLPCTPYVVGVLIKRLETPWAQLFPLRLQLRLGAEYRYYPCPLISTRNRPAVYGELGHTIMNLLADFKNFQYTLARVTGLVIHMEENRTSVKVPQDRYDEIVKILNATDEHVMALGANFSQKADSHLVCIQNEEGYKTQAINIQNQARKVTGASFIVFSGALKASSPFNAKVNIVEDGIMVQLMPKLVVELRHSLKEMQDYTIFSGIPQKKGDEVVVVEWVSRQEALQQTSVSSPIDGLQLDCFPCVKVHSACDFTRKSVFRIQWTEVYFLGDRRNSGAAWQQSASRDLKQLTAELAKAFCQACMPHLCRLNNDNLSLIGLRVNLDSDNVGYSTGSNNQPLAVDIMSDLDSLLVPVIHSAASRHRGHPLSVELFFKILKLL